MTSPLDQLLQQARSPLGPRAAVDLQTTSGPLAELGLLLTRVNGLTLFNAGVQVFHAGHSGLGPELQHWNQPATWKDTYGDLAHGLFCFGQDLFGRQFAVEHREHIVLFDPETAERIRIGTLLGDWAAWLLDDPDVNGTRAYATAWQDRFGPLDHNQRLIPMRFFTLRGPYDFDNIVAKPADECMRIRGPLAQQLHDLPDGAQVRLMPEQPSTAASDTEQLAYAELDVFADYNSFVVQDEAARFKPDRQWTRALITDLIAAAPGAVGVGTARRVTVPVILDVRTTAPDNDFDDWDHVTQASLHTDTGHILVSMFDYRDSIPRTPVPPGTYTARVYYRGFSTISSDGLHGDDLYRVVLWPGQHQGPEVLKRHPGPLPGG
jgi:hypothetical protein